MLYLFSIIRITPTRERWKEAAGWGSVADDSLEDWAPLGPDPAGCLPRAPELARPSVFVGWGFGNTRLTLYSYRSLESLLHVYPGAHVQFLTTGTSCGWGFEGVSDGDGWKGLYVCLRFSNG